ncbi:MAG: hypothetical protein AM324_002070 [Candidatus Thorarchaeota archaeon SMTZ1-83]|nr:MAG: hypothetical protein AM324_02985 [Candidatus Thorarchaeota archaeon SMTZ1-83]
MSGAESEIVKLASVTLTRDKQDRIEPEFGRYASATNYVIKVILKEHFPSGSKTLEHVREDFSNRFDKREQYLRDVVKTAWVEVGRHRRLAEIVSSMRNKPPVFKEGRMILSHPIVRVQEKGLNLETQDRNTIPIPFDKPSRNRAASQLHELATGRKKQGRVRMTWIREGYMTIDIRMDI